MKVSDFRDLIDAINRKADDFHSCVNEGEKLNWLNYAEQIRLDGYAADSPHCSARDLEMMNRAIWKLNECIDLVQPLAVARRIPLKTGLTGLRFKFDGEGSWEAASAFRLEECCDFTWKIVVCEDGTFSVGDSDKELTANVPTFQTFDAAVFFCDEREDFHLQHKRIQLEV